MTAVKICGVTNVADALLACDLGAWAIGMIFVPQSKRVVDIDQARLIVEAVDGRAHTVTVFANESVGAVVDAAQSTGCSAIQLHGSESPGELDAISVQAQIPIIRALRIKDSATVSELSEYRADFFLADSYERGALGGTGRVFDWSALGATPPQPLLLSGGLNSDNVGKAIRLVQPFGVDVSSGVESQIRLKDPNKLKALFSAVKEAS